ncbi:hypothetical protein NZNM25_02120 [Nitrosopumilus zosterae]|uniref:Uncharacterized protein n=1 Tax=Nitrosopumilus zosterae TaxID=718286 RepID=A0A2S2KPG8_9ARCH|nr:hypothetical protein [Nitrosopumilus zosterae]BDQ31211.1 hypothetical protein NZOSNM25_001322 [Nitrosopumilus zosterae]GBH33421.1 hypothetical protein NZNM25_02120 [Nitrosopumilus zosterae]
METLSKIAIYMGMGIACSIFVMFTISIMPHVVSQIENNWEDVLPGKSDEELKKMFYETDSYKEFNKKYPDNGEYFRSYGDGRGSLEVTAMNFESYNTLRLELEYDKRTDSVREDITCNNQIDNRNLHIRGTLAAQFIEKISCLEGSGIIDAPSNLIDEFGNPVPINISPRVTVDID